MKSTLFWASAMLALGSLGGCSLTSPVSPPSPKDILDTPFVPVYLETDSTSTAPSGAGTPIREQFPCHPRAEKNAVFIPDREAICPTPGIMDLRQGTIATWIRFDETTTLRDHVIVHTNDSRIVLYVHTELDAKSAESSQYLIARAVGNFRSTAGGDGLDPSFPEARFPLRFVSSPKKVSLTSPTQEFVVVPNQWYLVAMTWQGFPAGKVRLFFDGTEVAEHPYDQSYQNTLPWFQLFSVGFRPGEWEGEIRSQNGASTIVSAPKTAMSLSDGGISIRDLEVYGSVLTDAEIIARRSEKK